MEKWFIQVSWRIYFSFKNSHLNLARFEKLSDNLDLNVFKLIKNTGKISFKTIDLQIISMCQYEIF